MAAKKTIESIALAGAEKQREKEIATLSKIIALLIDVTRRTGLHPSDDALLQAAVTYEQSTTLDAKLLHLEAAIRGMDV